MMKKVPCPDIEWLMHNKLELLTPEQRERYDAVIRLSDLLNLALRDDMERTTGRYLPMLYTEFLEKLYKTVRTLEEQNRPLLIDDFIRIARFSLPALKHITAQPSVRIVKQDAKVAAARVRQTTPAAMRWLAKRPGRSVAEKIAPRNQVLTKVTRFTADTKENRETMYLYRILYDVVQSRMKALPCRVCSLAGTCGERERELQELLALHSRIRRGELADTPPEKQVQQNNKLMCGKYYKMVWDAVGQLSAVEEKLQRDWEKMEERYMQIGFWVVLAWILHSTDTAVWDGRGALWDKDGILWFGGEDAVPEERRRAVLYPRRNPERPQVLELRDSAVTLTDGASGTVRMEWVLWAEEKE